VVLVHGAVVNGMEMFLLRRRLRRLGYSVRQFHYLSMLRGLDENVSRLREFILATPGETLHVVGHSMGGILIRHAFERDPDPRPGRLIALGSPFLDCWVARRISGLHNHSHRLHGKTVRDHLASARDPIWRGAREFGVIAGTYPAGLGRAFRDLPLPHDGIIRLEETRLGGIADHVSYRLNHFSLLASRRCAAQMHHFLSHGVFAPVPAQNLPLASRAK
jgi:pimeloyl-ACP methyl ester carboxylesterase